MLRRAFRFLVNCVRSNSLIATPVGRVPISGPVWPRRLANLFDGEEFVEAVSTLHLTHIQRALVVDPNVVHRF